MGTRKKNRWLFRVFFVGGFCLGISLVGLFLGMYHQEHAKEVVLLQKGTSKVLFFYREDCPDCQELFPWMYWQSLWRKDVVFINLNQSKNRTYSVEYRVKSVPTVITPDGRVVGTDRQKIKQLWEE